MSLRTTRNLQLADTFFEQQRVYSPGCIAARAGQVYSIGARTVFGFKYRLQLAPAVAEQSGVEEAAAEQSVHEEVAGVVTEEEEYGSSENDFLDAIPVGDASDDLRVPNNEVEYDASATPVETSSKGSLVLASGADLALFVAQDILEQRIQDYLQKKLIYCPGSGYDNRDLTIDGVAVDLLPYGSEECDDDTRTSCLMTGTITLYQRFNNAQSSSLQSTQAGLESLRVGMNVENIFEDGDGIPISNVEFLGGVFDVGKPGEQERRDISLGGIGDLGGGVAVASVIVSTQNFIQSQGASLSHTGQGIVAIFAVAFFVLVVARRRKRARHARAVAQGNNGGIDSGERNLSDKDSWNEDGFVADEIERKDDEKEDQHDDDDDDPLESVEVYLVNRPNERDAFSRIFGLSKKKQRKEIDHISLSGLHG